MSRSQFSEGDARFGSTLRTCLETQSQGASILQTGPTHTERRESRTESTAPSSPELTMQTAGEWWTESPAHNLPAPQEGGRPCSLQALVLWATWTSFQHLPFPSSLPEMKQPQGISFSQKNLKFRFHSRLERNQILLDQNPLWNQMTFHGTAFLIDVDCI